MEGNYTLSDIRAVTDGNDGMFGGNGLWFLALLFLFGNGVLAGATETALL